MRSLGEDLFLAADVCAYMFAIVGLATILWILVFPPTISGFLPGCLSLIGALPIVVLLPLPLEATIATFIVHAMGHDLEWLMKLFKANEKTTLLFLYITNLPVGFCLVFLLEKPVKRISRLLRHVEDDSGFVGLNYNSLFRRRLPGHTVSTIKILCRELLRTVVGAIGIAVPLMLISYDSIYAHPSLVIAWMLIGSATIVTVMYTIYGAKLLLQRQNLFYG